MAEMMKLDLMCLTRIFLVLLLAALLLPGCSNRKITSHPVAAELLYSGMPNLAEQPTANRPAPFFGSAKEYTGSPVEEIGYESLFDVHPAHSSQIAILENGDASFAVRIQALEDAHTSIRIQALVFSGDEAGLKVSEILKRKKAEGLDVRVIVDAVSNLDLQTQWMYFDLKQHGIEVQGYESLYLQWVNEIPLPEILSRTRDPGAPNHRYHEKMWIIDGETSDAIAVVGGLNIANEYFRVNPEDPDGNWRDQDIIVKGRLIGDMVTVFERNFAHFLEIKKSRGLLNTDIYWEATRDTLNAVGELSIPFTTKTELVERVDRLADVSLDLDYVHARSRFFHNRPRLGETYIEQAYAKLVQNAEQEILICNAYFIPSKDFIEIVRKAVDRGVRVVILTNSPETNDLPEMSMVGRSYYGELLALNNSLQATQNAGRVQIWEWHGKRFDQTVRTEGTIHAKYAVFDRRYALVGSYNLDPRSEKLNSETAVVFESDVLATRLARVFYENDLAFSRPVTPQDAAEFRDPADAIYKLRKDFGSLFEPLL